MDYKLENGFVMKLNGDGAEVSKTYLYINATGYHGDMDYDVNNDTKIYFNDGDDDFKELISFKCFNGCREFDELKEEFQKLFEDEGEFQDMCDGWKSFCKDYSETHDEAIELDLDYWYMIDGKKYDYDDVELDIFNDDDTDNE